MTTHPEITVITIVYNGERYIKEAIDSILNQTYKDFEYVIVDNNSTDSTPAILKDYAQKDRRIKIIIESEQGILYARNAGLKVARGEWIAVLDADDIALPDRLECQLNLVRENPDVVLVGSGLILIDENGRSLRKYSYPNDHSSLVERLENHKAFFPQSSALIRRSSVMKLNGYRFSSAEDYDLWLRLSMEGKIACIQEPLIKLRRYVHSNSYRIEQRAYLVTKVVPLICHLRRKKGLSDPIVDGEDVGRDFIEWTGKRMKSLHVFEKAEAMREINRIRYNKDKGSFHKAYKILSTIVLKPFVIRAFLGPGYLAKVAEHIAEESTTLFTN